MQGHRVLQGLAAKIYQGSSPNWATLAMGASEAGPQQWVTINVAEDCFVWPDALSSGKLTASATYFF